MYLGCVLIYVVLQEFVCVVVGDLVLGVDQFVVFELYEYFWLGQYGYVQICEYIVQMLLCQCVVGVVDGGVDYVIGFVGE